MEFIKEPAVNGPVARGICAGQTPFAGSRRPTISPLSIVVDRGAIALIRTVSARLAGCQVGVASTLLGPLTARLGVWVIEEAESLRRISDPMERAKQAGAMQDRLQVLSKEVSRIRREAVEELLSGGMSQAEVGAALGLTRGRVSQLATSGPPPERLFFGDDKLTVAVGGKLEAGKPNPDVVMLPEDFRTFERLKDLARSLQLDADVEVIPPPGMLRLNRDNLVVICGPRLSPLLWQVLESDPVLAFEKDDDGWYLIDRKTDTVYRSPIDSGRNADIAYFGRLPRPDGRGTFLYMAGIHAPGPGGVADYLSSRLGELYREVRMRRFSTLIECEFDPETRAATGNRRLTPIYVHEGH